MIETRVDLFFGHRLDPLAVSHQSGGIGGGHAALVDADADTGRNVDSSARRVQFRIFAPSTKTQTHRFDGFRHGDDAANLIRADE